MIRNLDHKKINPNHWKMKIQDFKYYYRPKLRFIFYSDYRKFGQKINWRSTFYRLKLNKTTKFRLNDLTAWTQRFSLLFLPWLTLGFWSEKFSSTKLGIWHSCLYPFKIWLYTVIFCSSKKVRFQLECGAHCWCCWARETKMHISNFSKQSRRKVIWNCFIHRCFMCVIVLSHNHVTHK